MKYQTLDHLKKYPEFHILDFFIYSGNLAELQNLKSEKIILRSSYALEDGKEKSFAWVFRSLVVERKNIKEVQKNIDIILTDAKQKIETLGGNFENFFLMIQEYREITFGGVAFIEEDKFYIEISKRWSEWVVNGEVDQTIFRQKKLSIETGVSLLSWKKLDEFIRLLTKLQNISEHPVDVEFWVSEQGMIHIFQARPITKSIFEEYNLLDNSNIWENFPGTVSPLTFSFVKKLYAEVYRSTAHHSWINNKKLSQVAHIFDHLIAYKEGKIYYTISNWYKMLLLFPGNHKKSFDTMIGSSGNIRYLIIDDMIECLPKFWYKLKYFLLVLRKIFTFKRNLSELENYLEDFYDRFYSYDLKKYSLEGLQQMLDRFIQDLSYLWYVTIDNDFLIMKFQKGKNLQELNGLQSANQISSLKKLANKEIELEEYTKIYGERFWDELKLENPEFDYSSQEFQDILKKYKNIDIPETWSKKGGLIYFLINNREKFRIYRGKNFSVARKILLEIAERLVRMKLLAEKDAIFSLTLEQISNLIQSESKILSRENQRILLGNAFEGRVYKMEKFHIPKEEYDIIIAESFDPGWTVFLGWLKGIIIENGNLLSHISIISRELQIPLLMGAKWTLEKLKNWDRIRVTKDGTISKCTHTSYEPI